MQVPIDKINSVMTHEGKWKERGLGDTGETYLVSAADGTPRSIARLAVEDIEAYAKSVGDAGFAKGLVNAVTAKGTSIGLVPIKTQATQDVFEKGTAGFGVYPNYAKVPVLGAYAPLSVLGLKWAIVAEIRRHRSLRAGDRGAREGRGVVHRHRGRAAGRRPAHRLLAAAFGHPPDHQDAEHRGRDRRWRLRRAFATGW